MHQDHIDRGEHEGLSSDDKARLRKPEVDHAKLRMEPDLAQTNCGLLAKKTSTP